MTETAKRPRAKKPSKKFSNFIPKKVDSLPKDYQKTKKNDKLCGKKLVDSKMILVKYHKSDLLCSVPSFMPVVSIVYACLPFNHKLNLTYKIREAVFGLIF